MSIMLAESLRSSVADRAKWAEILFETFRAPSICIGRYIYVYIRYVCTFLYIYQYMYRTFDQHRRIHLPLRSVASRNIAAHDKSNWMTKTFFERISLNMQCPKRP
jgi:hypothetical protein